MTNRIFTILILVFSGVFSSSCTSHLFLQDDQTFGSVIVLDTVNVPADDTISIRIIEPYKKQLDEQMNEIIAYSEVVMRKNQPEGLLNNFIADLVFKQGNIYLKKLINDTAGICILNSGGLRCDLPKGSITLRNIYELLPFENEMVAVKISGENARKMFNYIAKKGGVPQSGAVMSIRSDTANYLSIGNKPFDITKSYMIITSDYLANGGDNMTFLVEPMAYYPLNVKLRELIIDCMKAETSKGETITSKLDKRIYYEK